METPSFRATEGAFHAYERWLETELLRSDEPAWVAGHSMGGALAVTAAVEHPSHITSARGCASCAGSACRSR